MPDAGTDAGEDAGSASDAGAIDAGATDAGAMDAGALDAGALDAGGVDAGVQDAGPSGVLVVAFPGVTSLAIIRNEGQRRLIAARPLPDGGGGLHEFRLTGGSLVGVDAGLAIPVSRLRSCNEGDGGQQLLALNTRAQLAELYSGVPLTRGQSITAFDAVCVDFSSATAPDDLVSLRGSPASLEAYLRPDSVNSLPVPQLRSVPGAEAVLANKNWVGADAFAWVAEGDNRISNRVTQGGAVTLNSTTTVPHRMLGVGNLWDVPSLLVTEVGALKVVAQASGFPFSETHSFSAAGTFGLLFDAGLGITAGELTPGARYEAFSGPFQLVVINATGVLGLGVNQALSQSTREVLVAATFHAGPATALAWGDLDGDDKAELVIATPTSLVVLRGD